MLQNQSFPTPSSAYLWHAFLSALHSPLFTFHAWESSDLLFWGIVVNFVMKNTRRSAVFLINLTT